MGVKKFNTEVEQPVGLITVKGVWFRIAIFVVGRIKRLILEFESPPVFESSLRVFGYRSIPSDVREMPLTDVAGLVSILGEPMGERLFRG
ncbi:hypothetical protein C447_13182 [Halococcus hamelinensis 100A6]|uniref:Uncharacterized protein n=1 Tax=Halococcus hamelinensis 100A6 TaxID=1132509 RepID=M0LXU8_9EURY|nr:hypothetical protein C447_13182 [Halococcus hamelinensis 100A6]